jgi:hypothetical protein
MSDEPETREPEKSAPLKRLERLVSAEIKTAGILVAAFIVVLFSGLEPTLQEIKETARDFKTINTKIQDNENLADRLVRTLVAEEADIQMLERFQRKYLTKAERDKERAKLLERYQAAQSVGTNLVAVTNVNQAIHVLGAIFERAGATSEVLRSQIVGTNTYYFMTDKLLIHFNRLEEGGTNIRIPDVVKAFINDEASNLRRWDERVKALATLTDRKNRLPEKRSKVTDQRTVLRSDAETLRKERTAKDRKVDFELLGLKLHVSPIPAALLWLALSVVLIGCLAHGRVVLGDAYRNLSGDDRTAAEEFLPTWKRIVFPDLLPVNSSSAFAASVGIPFLIVAAQFRVVWITWDFNRYLGTTVTRSVTAFLILSFSVATAWFAGWWFWGERWKTPAYVWKRNCIIAGGAVLTGGVLLLLWNAPFASHYGLAFSAQRVWIFVGASCLLIVFVSHFPASATSALGKPLGQVYGRKISRRSAIIGVCLIGLAPMIFLKRPFSARSGSRGKSKRSVNSVNFNSGFFKRENARKRQVVFHYIGKKGQVIQSDEVPNTLKNDEISQTELPPILSQIHPEPSLGLRETSEFVGGYMRQVVVFARALCEGADGKSRWLWQLIGQDAQERIRTVVNSFAISSAKIKNMGSLADKLLEAADEISEHIVERLSPVTKGELTKHQKGTGVSVELQTRLLEGLNRIVTGRFLGDYVSFDTSKLRKETAQLLGEQPHGPCLARLNRLLLEDTYPDEFVETTDLSDQCHAYNLKAELAEAISGVIEGGIIYSDERFGRIERLPDEIAELLDPNLEGDQLRRVNLLLLAHSFPAHIRLNHVPRHRMQLAASSWAFEEAAIHILSNPSTTSVETDRVGKRFAPAQTKRVCQLLMSALVHDSIFKTRLPNPRKKGRLSFRLYDLLAGVSVRFKHHDHFAQLLQFIERLSPGERLLFQSRLGKWNDSRGGWRIKWRDRKVPIIWRSSLGVVVF